MQAETQYFIDNNEHLKNHIGFLCIYGSNAHGTAIEGSDLDIRGFATPSTKDILLCEDFEQVQTPFPDDVVIYSSNKFIRLLSNSNPNVIEWLGLKPEHYLQINDAGKLLLDNKKLFLSRDCIFTFGGYAKSQWRKLRGEEGGHSQRLNYLAHKGVARMSKHMMHLVRLELTLCDLLEKEEIITYRPERELLLDIRNGKFTGEDCKPIPAFYELVEEIEQRLDYAEKNSSLQAIPKYKEIRELRMEINLNILKEGV